MLGKFEDTWIEDTPLPDLQTIDCNQNLLFKCIRLIAFLQVSQTLCTLYILCLELPPNSRNKKSTGTF
jgi:hypothetical protein